ncbi:hypothetical protein PAE9249_01937 [Paenibacillus sp. CECT 9249]|nr:hypothetical protein PAE9249_01937 [Paenibacillus sp. CECT 9249]
MKKIGVWIPLALLLAAAFAYLGMTMNQEAAASTLYIDESIRIDIGANTAPAHSMQEVEFIVTVSDVAGVPVGGQDLQVVLSMPGMFCGSFPAVVTERETGTYAAVGVPVMRGRWQAEVRVDMGGKQVRVGHPFQVVS